PDRGYDPTVNAGINQVFSTAAYRLGHTLLSPHIPHLDEHGNSLPSGPLTLRDVFFNPTPPLLENEGIERGLACLHHVFRTPQVTQLLTRFLGPRTTEATLEGRWLVPVKAQGVPGLTTDVKALYLTRPLQHPPLLP